MCHMLKKNFVDHCKKYWLFYTFSEIKGEGGGILKLYRYFIVSVQKMGRKTYSFLVTRSYLVFSLIIKIKCGKYCASSYQYMYVPDTRLSCYCQ